MKTSIRLIILSVVLLCTASAKSQVLISLLFGDKLNTPNIEFGLIGGANQSFILDIEESKGMSNFNIGFYFHILMMKSSYLSTGVLVKSNVGATGMPTYSIDDPDFDDVFKEGTLTKQFNYFYVPILFQQRFNDNRWYLEGGLQLGLRNKANDYFDIKAYNGKVSYETDIRDEITHFDGGLMGGAGYKIMRRPKSIAVGVNYYYGLKNVSKVEGMKIKNSSVYMYIKIPIGLGKSQEKDV